MVGHIDSSSHVRSCLQLAYIQLSFEQVAAHPGFQPCHRRAKLASASPSLSKPPAQAAVAVSALPSSSTPSAQEPISTRALRQPVPRHRLGYALLCLWREEIGAGSDPN